MVPVRPSADLEPERLDVLLPPRLLVSVAWQPRFGYELTLHHPPGRQAYARPGSGGKPVGSAEWPSCLLVWRRA